MAKARPFTCCEIAWPFARLATASFYVYILLYFTEYTMGIATYTDWQR